MAAVKATRPISHKALRELAASTPDHSEAFAAYTAAYDRREGLSERIAAFPPATVEAISLKADVLKRWHLSHLWEDPEECLDWPDSCARAFLESLIGARSGGQQN